jgi:fluoroquinolone transport system permease protein
VSALRAFGANDLRSVLRDPLLLYMLLIPPLMVLLVRLILPTAADYLSASFGFDLTPYYPLLLSLFFVLQVPLLFGVLVGLMVLDERDDDTLTALRVTPISMPGYALYRGGAAVILSFFAVLVELPASGFVTASLLPAVAPVALLSALLAPNFALALAAFARNKVEGLALMKGLSVFMLGPLAAYFIGFGWQLLLGVFPTYWPVKAFWVAGEGGDFWPYVLAGLAYNLLLLVLLLCRFRKRVF